MPYSHVGHEAVEFPFTSPQRDIWFDHLLNPDLPMYNIGGYMHLAGSMDLDRLRHAVRCLLQKHDALRMVLTRTDDAANSSPQWKIANEELRVDVAFHDFSSHDNSQAQAMAWMQQKFVEPFDLSNTLAPLFRYELIKFGDDSFYWFVCYHHLIADGWTIALLLRSLADIYNVLDTGQPLNLAAPSYVNFICDDDAYTQSSVFARQRKYWLEKFATSCEPLIAPGDQVRPLTAQVSTLALTREVDGALAELAARNDTSILHVVLGLLYVYFTRTTQHEQIAVGLAVHNRNSALFKTTAGLFADVSPALFAFGNELNFGELLSSIREELKQDYRHQRFPVSEIGREIAKRDGVARALFDVMVSYEKRDYDIAFGAARGAPVMMNSGYQSNPLTIVVREFQQTEPVEIDFVFQDACFNLEEIQALQRRLLRILAHVQAQPDIAIRDLVIVTDEEHRRLTVEWNTTAQPLPAGTLAHLFEARVRRAPGAIAVVCENVTLTYGELNQQANRWAHQLQRLGVKPESMVGIHLERSADMIIAMLAVLKAGGAYLPLDPGYPQERLAYMLEDARPMLVLTRSALRERLLVDDARIVTIDKASAELSIFSGDNPVHATLPANLAYVIYTSGSTGKPKGVAVSQHAVKRLVCDTTYLPLREDDRVAQAANSSFDATTFEVWSTLLHGCQLHVIPYAAILSPPDFAAQIREKGITTLFITTALFNQFARIVPDAFGGMRHLLFGGEAVDPRAVRALLRHGRPQRLLHMYGPTESTTFSSWYPIVELPENARTIPIGRPILNTRFYVLGASLGLMPPGVPGELYLGGEGLAHGYLNRPELTAEKFLPDPFSPIRGARMYKTGDRVKYLADGNIEYVERIDRQVKVRGFRIELGEVEAGLLADAAVRDAAVLAEADESGAKRLIAYVVLQATHTEMTMAELRDSLQRSLPDYMVPSYIVLLDALPLTPNGKVDRGALPAPESEFVRDHASTHVAPNTPNERLIAGIWADVLRTPDVGVRDNFFSLGGHSLLAMTLIERIRRAGLHVNVQDLFAHPTIAGLAGVATGIQTEAGDIPPNRIAPKCQSISPDMLTLVTMSGDEIGRIVESVQGGAANVQDIYPLAPLQEGILLHHLLSTGDDPYLLSLSFGFTARTHLDRFLHALQRVIDRHDILRTAIFWEGLAEPVQVVWRQAVMRVDELRAGAAPRDDRDPEQERVDVRQAPLMRGLVVEDTADARWTLRISLHHLIGDFQTMEKLIAETMMIVQDNESQLPDPVPFRNFIARLARSNKAAHEAFFKKMLSDIDEPTAPFDLLDVQGDHSKPLEARQELDPALSERLHARVRLLGVSAASVMHLAWAQVLGRITGRRDVVFGTVMSGRSDSSAAAAMGLFINSLPVRVRLGGVSVIGALRDTQALLREMLEHETAPLPLALRCSGVPTDMPLFSAILNYRHGSVQEVFDQFRTGLGWDGMALLGVEERTRYPMSLSVEDTGKSFFFVARTNAAILPDRLCGFMSAALASLLDGLEFTPDLPLHSIDVLPGAQRTLLATWNLPSIIRPVWTTATSLFEAQVARSPDDIALVFEGRSIDYATLNRRANRVAHYLLSRGVGPEDIVGICMERSLDMIVAVLGVLKAGGAYLPLDPAVPSAPLSFMLDDARPSFLLTQEHVFKQLPPLDCAYFCLDARNEQLSSFPFDNPPAQARPDHLAYVIYTSGSTGKPKGVLLYHRALANLVQAQADVFGIHAGQRMLQWASFNFDVSVSDIFTALCSGATLYMASREAVMPGQDLWNTLREHRIGIVAMTASALAALPQEPLPDLKTMVIGGERLDVVTITPWLASHQVINVYGPTEATVCTLVHPCDPATLDSPPIGRTLANTRAYVLDSWLRPLPIGAAGELYLAGDGLARGYLNRPDLSAERFIANPYGMRPGERMYKTGDLVRYLPDGNIEYLGRTDRQVKIRGYRIELEEIEFALGQLPEVREAAVLMKSTSSDMPFLVAYVASVSSSFDADALRRALSRELPGYMIPAHFVRIDRLPISTNGKIDRVALDTLTTEKAETSLDAPLTPTEKKLAAIWVDLTGYEQVARSDDFFHIGGHSLLLVKLIARIKREFGVALSVSQVFSSPTLSEFALAIEGALPRPSLIVTLQNSSAGIPVFLLHPSGGTIFAYEKLARRLGAAGPVHAIQSPEIAGLETDDYDFETLCRRYAEEITKACTTGAVRIAGWSMGGMLALGVAAVLERGGRSVERVAMFDTHKPKDNTFATFPEFLTVLLESQSEPGPDDSLYAIYECLRHLVQQYGVEHAAVLLTSDLPSSREGLQQKGMDAASVEFIRAQYGIQLRHLQAMRGFHPALINAPIHLVWANTSMVDSSAPVDWLAWTHDRNRSTQRILPGDHMTVIQSDSNQDVIVEMLTSSHRAENVTNPIEIMDAK